MGHNTQKTQVITLDGPSGTGKGTLCHLLAKHLGWHVLDSGAIYRVLAYAAKTKSIAMDDVNQLTQLARDLDLHFAVSEGNESIVLLEKENVAQAIRTEQCGQDASQLAVIHEVREALLQRQRDFAKPPGLVTDGRDMGTVVFPEAVLKLFLYAKAEERANRRYLQLKKQKINVSLAEVVEELHKRDTRDAARLHAPLKAATDAILIDTTGLSINQVFDQVIQLLDERLNKP